MECTGNVFSSYNQHSMGSDVYENVIPSAMDRMSAFEEDEVTSPVFQPIGAAFSSPGIPPSNSSSQGREEQEQQDIASLESTEPSNSSNQGQKEHEQHGIASLECIEAPSSSIEGQQEQPQHGTDSLEHVESSNPSNQGQKEREQQEEQSQEQRGLLKDPVVGSGEAILDVSREPIDPPPQNPSTLTEALDAYMPLSGLQTASARFYDSGVSYSDVRTDKEIFTGDFEYRYSKKEESKAGASCGCKECLHADKFVGQDVFGSVVNSKMLDSGLSPPEEAAAESNVPDMEKSECQHIDELLKPFQGDSIVSYFLQNAKLIVVLFTNLLLLPRVLKRRTFEKLMKDKALPTPKSTVERMAAENFASEGVNIAKQWNERATGECREDQLVGALGCPLGKSVAIVLAEVMENNFQQEQGILSDKLSKLLGLAIRESLFQVLGSRSDHLSRDFEAAFSSTFKTITLVRQEYNDKQRTSCRSEWKVSRSHGEAARLATNVCNYDAKNECADVSRNEEVGIPSMGGKFQMKPCKRRHVHENSWCPGSAWEHRMKGGGQESCKASFMKPDKKATPKIPEEILNCSGAASNDCRDAGHEHKLSGAASVVNEECNNLDHGNSHMVDGPVGNGHLSYSKVHSASSEIESIQSFEDLKLKSADCVDSIMEDLSFSATNSTICTGERIAENECKSTISDHCDISSMPGSYLNQQLVLHGQFQQQLTNAVGNMPGPRWPHSICNVLEKSVMEQQRCNDLKAVELGLTMRQIDIQKAQVYVDSVSNDLRRQKISLNQSKASFRESEFIDRKLTTAYVELGRTCADELVTGLVLMLLALAYGGWKHSYAHFSEAVAMCQPSTKDQQKSSWFSFYKPVDYVTGHFHTLLCELMVIGRMLLGLAIIAIIASSLLRHTVTGSSQAMPATIILIVLGCFCGWAGKFSVDSLGGSGFHWLLLWEILCLFHAFSACFTSTLFHILNGPASTFVGTKGKVLIPFWTRKLVFHTIILLVLPITAGLTPFASVREWAKHFSLIMFDGVIEPVRIYVRDNLTHIFLV